MVWQVLIADFLLPTPTQEILERNHLKINRKMLHLNTLIKRSDTYNRDK